MDDPKCKRCWRPAAHNVYGFCPECMKQMAFYVHRKYELIQEGSEDLDPEKFVRDMWEHMHPRRG